MGQLRTLKCSQRDLIPTVSLWKMCRETLKGARHDCSWFAEKSWGGSNSATGLGKGTQHILSWACKCHCSVCLEVCDLTETPQHLFMICWKRSMCHSMHAEVGWQLRGVWFSLQHGDPSIKLRSSGLSLPTLLSTLLHRRICPP